MVDLGTPTARDAFERVRLVVVKLYLMKKNIFEGTQLALYCYTTALKSADESAADNICTNMH